MRILDFAGEGGRLSGKIIRTAPVSTVEGGSKLPDSPRPASRAPITMEEEGTLIIKGIRIDREVLRKEGVRRCAEVNCLAACCTDGVWLCDDEPPLILEWADAIKASLPADRHDESKWFEQGEGEVGTASVDDPLREDDTCCVFLQPDRKCALQVVSEANRLGWPGIKPYYCALYPLYLEDGELLVDDITPQNVIGAMCRQSRSPKKAMYELYREEAILVLGEDGYKELCEKAKAPGRRRRSRGEKR